MPSMSLGRALAARWAAHSRRRHVVRQHDQADCGPAALLTVLRAHGGDASMARVRALTMTDARGTSLASLVEGARSLGFTARGASGTLEALAEERLPCIAHVLNDRDQWHFVVVYAIGQQVVVGDPGLGRCTMSRGEFERRWVSRAVVLLNPTPSLVIEHPPHWITWLASYCRADRAWLYQTVFLGFIYTGLALASSLLIRQLVDFAIPSHDRQRVWMLGGLLLGMQGIRAGAGYLRLRFLADVGARVSVRMTRDFLGHIFRLPASFFDSRSTGDITTRVADAVKIQSAIVRAIGGTLTDVFLLVGSLAVVCLLAPDLGWVIVAAAALYAAALYPFTRPIRDQQGRAMQAYSAVESTYIDSLTGAQVVTAYSVDAQFAHLNGGLFETFQERLRSLGRQQATIAGCADLLGGMVVTAILIAATLHVVDGRMELGVLLALYSLVATALPSISRLLDTNVAVQGAAVASGRLLDLLNVAPESRRHGDEFRLTSSIALQGVSHRWPNGPLVLEDVSMEIPRGCITALLGASGSGKSTIVTLLERRYQPTIGAVLVDGKPAMDIELTSYRRGVTVVPEHSKIFTGTLAFNITLGRTGSGSATVDELIHTFNLEHFFSRFPYGPQTRIGDGGHKLSSGERQVVSLLRALVSRPALLVLDEGLNALDGELAAVILRVLRRFADANAVLLISHNPATVASADRAYVIQHRRVLLQDAEGGLLPVERSTVQTGSTPEGRPLLPQSAPR